MQLVLIYTVEHTGGRFLGNVLKQAYPPRDRVWLGDIHFKHRGRTTYLDKLACSEISRPWAQEHIVDYLDQADQEKKLVLVHAHHNNPAASMIPALNKKPTIPVVSTVRDPILAVNTAMWTSYALGGVYPAQQTYHQRQNRIATYSQLIEDIVSIPRNNICLYPVDLLIDQEKRYTYTSNLTKQLDIPYSQEIKDIVRVWPLVGDTKQSKHLNQRSGREGFLAYKQVVIDRDHSLLQELLKPEMEYLNKQHSLKDKLINIGYEDLCWY